MARWLVAHPGPEHSVGDVYHGWVEGLRELGQDVHEFNFGDRLVFYSVAHLETVEGSGEFRQAFPDDEDVIELALNGLAAALWKIRPDVLFIVSGFFWDAELLDLARKEYGITVVILHTELPYEEDRELMSAPYADLHLLNDQVSVPKFSKICRAVYCPHAYRPSVHFPATPPVEFRYDVAFAGTGFKSRIGFLEQVDLDGLEVILAGNWMSLPEGHPLFAHVLDPHGNAVMTNAHVADLYRTMRVGLNLFRREANHLDLIEGHSCGPREIEMAACGAFFLRDPRPESDGLFPMLPSFTSAAEASDLLRWWLDPRRDGARAEAGAKAREAVKDRTFTNHAAQVMRLLGINT